MITILIIGMLAAAVLGVAAVAGETAREAKTRNLIARLHTLLMEHYDTYKTRRVKLRKEVVDAIDDLNAPAARKGRLKAEARLYALREMILMEVPDRWSDVLLEGVPPTNGTPLVPIYLKVPDKPDAIRRTELAGIYLRQYRRIAGATNKITNNTNTAAEITENQGAECLYLVIMNATGDGEARTLVPQSSIGDTDGDGAFEFIDGWGHPIEFLRWAPGFDSEIQVNANKFGKKPPANPNTVTAWVRAASADHDPFDLYRVELAAFRLVPLIFSAGRDELYSLNLEKAHVAWVGVAPNDPFNPTNPNPPRLRPWAATTGPPSVYLGTDNGKNASTDNIHNHLIATR